MSPQYAGKKRVYRKRMFYGADMNEHSLRVLEFDKVLDIVAGYAVSEPGKKFARRMMPVADREMAAGRLRETRELMNILQRGESPPLDGILDVGQAIQTLGVAGMTLSPAALLNIALTLAAGRRVGNFFQRFAGKSDTAVSAPLLCLRAASIRPLKQLEDAVFSAIDERAEMRDSASPDLRRIRKQISRTRDDILRRLSDILQDSGFQKVIQEPVITIRDDRYVLPLKPNFRQNLRGVVHGQSGSRATLFVEPLEVLEHNNRLAELRLEERDEVDRILRELTMLLSHERHAIGETIDALAAIDGIYGRARLGIELNGTIPEFSEEGHVRLRKARHPLLVWKQKNVGGVFVSPNDIELSKRVRALVLSGPNAGGKTVILKTVGLLSLMAQAGMPLTAAEGSELPFFSDVFADIGDEQSLEQDLSTFSSHVGHIAGILRQADQDSLVLLDELGSGTDPSEGAGLGAAVLDNLIERGCMSLVTTHHNMLKLFGAQTTGALNASMEFNPLTLKPTYHLIPGRPGRSFGLDMAAKLGIPDDVIQKARARISEDDIRLENLLKQVETDAQQLAVERELIVRGRAAVEQERQESKAILKTAEDKAQDIKAKARIEAIEVVASLKRKLRELSEATILEQAEHKKVIAEIESLRRKLEPSASDQGYQLPTSFPDLHPGDRVQLPRWNRPATVLASNRGLLELEMDGKKLKMQAMEVLPIEPLTEPRKSPHVSGWSADLSANGASDRLNIIGYRVTEGIAEVERFVDCAGAQGMSTLTIIHGLGTGALKSAVESYLRNHPLIATIRGGTPAEGGAGVTVVELKK
jgi:DNA mismatch repair protein MutS2